MESERHQSVKYTSCHWLQRKTSLFRGVKLRWTTGTLALLEIVSVCGHFEYVRLRVKRENEFLFGTSRGQKEWLTVNLLTASVPKCVLCLPFIYTVHIYTHIHLNTHIQRSSNQHHCFCE